MFQLKLVPADTKIPFISWRRPAMTGSAILFVLSLMLAFAPGLNFGIDFRGGILIEVQTQGPADLAEMRNLTNSLGLGEVSLQEFGADDTVLIRIEKQPGDATAQQVAVTKLRAALGEGIEYRRTEFVGPKVSGELIQAGAIAIALAVVLMLVYIWFRLPDVLNLAINDTLSRTTMTSVTTLLALFVLFIFGGSVIPGFVFAMIWGVIVGTYSSIFIAAPLLIVLGLGDRHRSGEDKSAVNSIT